MSSNGGHFDQLCPILDVWPFPFRVASFDTPDVADRISSFYKLHHPTNRNSWNFIRNTFLAVKWIREYEPEVIISTGAGPAVPFFLAARVMSRDTLNVYVEPVDRLQLPTLTARLSSRLIRLLIVQHSEQLSGWSNRVVVPPSI